MESLLIFSLLAIPLLLIIFYQKTHKKNLHLPPGPKGLPFVGNLHQFDSLTPHTYLTKLSQKYGPLMTLRLGSRQILVVSSAKMAEQVIKTHDFIFRSRPSFLGQQKLSYNGLDIAFTPYDSYWREMRKLCVIHLFSANRVQSYTPIREFEVSQMLENMSKLSVACKPVDLSEAMMSLTITTICRVAFGKRYTEEESEGTRFRALLEETQALFTSFFVSDYFPGLSFVDTITGLKHRLEKNFRDFDNFYDQVIKERLDPSRSRPEQEDILDVLLQIWKDGSFKAHLTPEHIKAVLMNIFVGATDASAATVVWAMTFLMKNPEAMKKAQEEVRQIIGKKGFVNEDDTHQLSYLKAVIKEIMRLQPTAPLLIPRESSEDCNVGGYKIPAKTIVYVNVWAIGRDPDIWKNPEEFCPERFVGNSIDLKGQDFELIPFGAGRRICPGLSMGLAIVELALANLIYKFDWEMPDGMEKENFNMDMSPGLTMHKKNALHLMARKYI